MIRCQRFGRVISFPITAHRRVVYSTYTTGACSTAGATEQQNQRLSVGFWSDPEVSLEFELLVCHVSRPDPARVLNKELLILINKHRRSSESLLTNALWIRWIIRRDWEKTLLRFWVSDCWHNERMRWKSVWNVGLARMCRRRRRRRTVRLFIPPKPEPALKSLHG